MNTSAQAACGREAHELGDAELDRMVGGEGFFNSIREGYMEAQRARGGVDMSVLTPDQRQQLLAGNPLPRPR